MKGLSRIWRETPLADLPKPSSRYLERQMQRERQCFQSIEQQGTEWKSTALVEGHKLQRRTEPYSPKGYIFSL